MAPPPALLPVSSILLDESIYSRKGIDPRRMGMPQDRMAKQLGLDQKTIHNHLGKLAALPNLLNDDLRVTFRLSRGFTVAPVAEKHGWTDPMAGGGVTPDTCLVMGRRCRAFDMKDRSDTRPEIDDIQISSITCWHPVH